MSSPQRTPVVSGARVLRGLRRSFEALVALDGLSFWVPAGSVFGLILDAPFAGLDPIATDVMVTATGSTGMAPQATSIFNIQAASTA